MTDTTSGSDSREPRALDEPLMAFELDREIDLLRREDGYREFGRSSKTLGKGEHVRLVLTAAKAGTELGDSDAEAPVAVQVLDGAVTLARESDGSSFGPGALVWLGEGDWWSLRVERDAALILSIGWPGGPAEAR